MTHFNAQKFIQLLTNNPLIQSVGTNLLHKLEHLDATKPILIAVAGESATGKSFLMQILAQQLPQATYLATDNYFRDFSGAIKLHGSFDNLLAAGYNLQAPFSIHMDILRENLMDLKAGKNVLAPYHPLDDSGMTLLNKIPIKSAPFIFVDGYCTLYDDVRDLFDFSIYLEPEPVYQREVFAHLQKERGRPAEQAQKIYKILSTSSEVYIEPTKQYADAVINVFKAPQKIEEELVKNIISFFTQTQTGNLHKATPKKSLIQKVLDPNGDLKAVLEALSDDTRKCILEELKNK